MSEKRWETYEEVAQFLLNEMADRFGLVKEEGKQLVVGQRSGTEWEIEAKGLYADASKFVIIECRRYTTSKLKQEHIGAIAYRILDTGAAGGIVVTPIGLQEGAEKVATAENIISVKLDPKSTTTDYVLSFLKEIHVGFSDKIQMSDRFCLVARDAKTGKIIETRGDISILQSDEKDLNQSG